MAKKKKTKNTMPTVEEYEAKRKGYISVDEYEENRKNGKYSFENYQKQKQEKQKRYGNQSELKNYLNRINAGRKAIKDTITQPFTKDQFQKTDPFGKRLQAMKDGKALLKLPETTAEEKKALVRYGAGKSKQAPSGVPYSEDSKVYRGKEDIAAAYIKDVAQRKAQQQAQQTAQDNAKVSGKGYTGYEAVKPEMGKVSVKSYNTMNSGRVAGMSQGKYDTGSNIYYMSDKGLQTRYDNSRAEEDRYNAQAKGIKQEKTGRKTEYQPDVLWGSVYDLTADLDQRSTKNAVFGQGSDADRQQAAADLDRMRADAEEGKKTATERAKEVFGKHQAWLYDESRPEELREMVYDEIMPDTYAERVASMTPEQKAELDRRIDAAIANETEGVRNYQPLGEEYYEAESTGKTYGAIAKETEDEINRRTRLGSLEAYIGNEVPDSGEYDPELVSVTRQVQTRKKEGAEGLQDTAQWIYHPQGSAVDQAYFWMNFRPETEEEDLYNTPAYVQKEFFATPEMVENFNSFYKFDKENGTNLAGQFLDALDPYLSACLSEYKDYQLRENAEDPYTGWLSRLAAVPANAVGGLLGVAGTGLAALGVESAKDPNNDLFYGLTRFARTTREQQNENADDAVAKLLATGPDGKVNQDTYDMWRGKTRFLLNVADSVADNLFAMGTAGAVTGNVSSKAGMAVVQWVMSSEAASNTMLQKLEEGYDPTEAVWYALGDGIIEWVTERVSLEALLKPNVKEFLGDWKQLAKYWMKTQVAEGSEEIASDMLNWALDNFLSETYNHRTEIEKRVQGLVAGGMDPKEAEKMALKEKYEQTAMSGLAGFISGGVLSGGRIISNKIANVTTGSAINAKGNESNGMTGAQRVIKLGLAMNGDTQSNSFATQLQQQIDNGEQPSNYQIGKLHQMIAMETSEEQAKIAENTLQRLVRDQLMEEGVEQQDAEKYAGVITKNLTKDGKMNPADLATLARDERAINLWKTYNSNTAEGAAVRIVAQANIYNETQQQRSVMDTLGELTGKNQVSGRSAMAAQIRNAVKNTTSTTEAIDYLQQHNQNLISEEYAEKVKTLLDSDERAKESKTLLDDAVKIRMAAMTLSENIPQTNLSKEAAQELFKAARTEFEETDKLRLTNSAKIVPGQGVTTYLDENGNTVAYGTKEWTEGIRPFNKTVRNQMGAVALIAKQFGHRVQFINDPNRNMVNGWENAQDGSIVINVATGMKHSMLATIVHEMTHVLEQNSWEDYNKLRQFIVNSLRKNGVNVEQEILNTILNQERVRNSEIRQNGKTEISSLSMNDAMNELVAKSCEGLLESQEMKDALAKADPTLFGKVKNVVRNIIARINNALESVTGTQSRESILVKNQADEIAKLWLGAREAAVNKPGTLEVTPAENQAYSILDTNGNEVRLTEDELNNNKVKVSQSPFVVSIPVNNFAKTNEADFKTRAYQYIDEHPTANNKTIGTISIEHSGIDHLLNYLTARRAGLLEAVIPVIENGEIIYLKDADKRHNFDSMIIAAPVQFEDKPYYMGVVIKQDTDNKNSYYMHDAVFIQANEKGTDQAIKSQSKLAAGTAPTIASILMTIPEYNGNSGRSFSVVQMNEDMRDELAGRAQGHIQMDEEARALILNKYGINENDIPAGIVFDEDGKVEYQAHDAEEKKLIRKISKTDLREIRALQEDMEKWRDIRDSKKGDADRFNAADYLENAEEIRHWNEAFADEKRWRELTGKKPVPREAYATETEEFGRYRRLNRQEYDKTTEQLDAEYDDAVAIGNMARAEEMLLEKLERTEGIIPYRAPHGYAGRHQTIAKEIKTKYGPAIAEAVEEMAPNVPENAVLIPMPPSTGEVNEQTDTYVLAQALSEATGRPVVVALQSDPRKSRYKAKQAGEKGAQVDEMGFRQVEEIPDGTMPVFVDNVVGKGVTAQAAHDAIGYGITLAYAKSTRGNVVQGLKNLTVTYDADGNLIPLSKRLDVNNPSVKYSLDEAAEADSLTVEQGDQPIDITNANGDSVMTILPGNTVAATEYSLSSYTDLHERDKMIKALKKAGYTKEQIDSWIKNLDNIADLIASNRTMYDFVADRSKKFLKDNGDVYKKTLDANTMCKKTRLYNGTFNVVQHLMPNTILMPEDLIDLYNIMKDMDLETPCGFCYVQSRRRLLGQYTEEWLKEYKGEYIPKVDEVTTSDGLEQLKKDHPQAYTDFVDAMNSKGVNNPKLVQQRTDYRGEIRNMRDTTIAYLKRIGGLRIQSFSDFEVVHMLDMMQAVMDMKARGLTAQAYTKVPEFAWIFGRTGIKINLSLVGKGTGLDAKGNLVFDNSEGINSDEAMRLREAYSENVGTILVGINDAHIIAAMGDSRIDFIIPFHKSGWSENELKKMRGLDHYSDYTASQNEYNITKQDKNGKILESAKAESNIDPLSYWDFSVDGEANARKYLQICTEQKIVPKFSQFLTDNGDGSFSLPEGTDQRSTNIRTGYWKTLIDFKMYNNEGIGAPQMEVEPNFNMDEAYRILNEYDGSHRELPESWEAAEEYVRRYKAAHPLDNVRTMYSVEQAPDMEVHNFMMGLNPNHMNTEQERIMLKQYQELRAQIESIRDLRIVERAKQIRALENKKETSVYDREKLRELRNIQKNDEQRLERLEAELARVTRSEKGFARMMYKQARTMTDLVTGRTAGELQGTVKAMSGELDNVAQEMKDRAERLKALAEKDAVLRIRAMFNRSGLKQIAARLKAEMGSTLSNEAIENRLALIALKMKQGEFDQENTMELADMIVGKMSQRYDSYILDELRGSTIVLSPVQLKELKGQNRTLAEIRRDLAGTGIRIGTKGTTSLEAKWDSLCDLIPSLNRDETATGMLDALMRVITSEKYAAANQYGDTDSMIQISEKILTAAQELIPEIVSDPKSLKLIRETLAFAQEMAGEARTAAEAMDDIGKMIERLQKTGAKAGREAGELSGNIQDAIAYFNDLAEQSDAAMWRSERIKLIEQLKSENTQNILAEQAKWKERIEKDKTARQMMESNLQLRKKITTNFARMRKLLINETDQQNIPEYMKSLARYMVGLITENDLTNRKLTGIARKDLMETARVLDIMKEQDGVFSIDDLRMISDEEAQAAVADALADLEDGIGFYNSTPGKDLLANLQAFHNSLDRISEAVSTITSVINAERSLSFLERRMDVADAAAIIRTDMKRSRFKGELTGRGSKGIRMAQNAVVYGNTTPVYFIKNLMNRGMDMLWEDMTQGENRNGLEMQKAKDYIGALAEKTGYKDWAGETHDVVLGGRKVKMTIENMMELYAIWKREQTTNPEMSEHLTKGGVYIQEDEKQEGKLRHERKDQRAIRVTDDEVAAMYGQMTDAQKEYMEQIVSYLSNEMSALGNEASMRMYGIRKYKESYYFPMKVWDGVKSARSDRGISGVDENRAAHKSWSKRRKHMASNALVIGNFTQDAVNHIVEMINYNTMSPAIENVNKVLNFQFTEGENADEATKRNMRILFQENYGKEALQYLEQLLKDLNGGAVQDQRKTLRDRLLTVFKKNAVAGSLSVAAQQPLSYIRAAMMINPKYLAAALSPQYWKGSYEEMNRYSGVAVIKDMGRFDMNFGQSAKDFITPETKLNVYEKISDVLTMAPQLMDRMTWTRMWSAVKMEQHAQHPDMDMKSDKFLKMVATRFNEVMRRTQVYDSVLVKSSNMRSQNYGLKVITSFMAEPTLSLNVLADAVRNARQEGGMANLGKAAATFLLSAVMQALVKGVMSSGRTPDEKKTWMENLLNKFQYNVMSELNPLGLIPGYNDVIEVLKTGELQDDAMGVIGKLASIIDTGKKAIQGKGRGAYRDIEDTAGQLAQMFTNIPAKNLMRDARAMWNWATGEKFANRETSPAVLKYQAEANLFTGDNLTGTLNKWLSDAGFVTTNSAYYSRIYQAMRNGNQQEADELREYLTLGKGVEDETIDKGIKAAAKKDNSQSDADRTAWMIDEGMLTKLGDVTSQYKEGKITRKEAEDLMRRMDPEITEDEIFWKLDLIDYKNETGNNNASGKGYRLNDAIRNNKADEIRAAVDDMMAHGVTAADIKKSYLSDWKDDYLAADLDGKRKIRDALQKAYRAIGYTAEDADKAIEKWVKDAEKKNK